MSEKTMNPVWIPLTNFTPYSITMGALRLDEIKAKMTERGIPAFGITDYNTLAGIPEWSTKLYAAGIQPLCGMHLKVSHPGFDGTTDVSLLTLFAQNEKGWKNLVKLASEAGLNENTDKAPAADISSLKKYNEGIICLSGGKEGPVNKAFAQEGTERGVKRLQTLSRLFPDRFYVEINRMGYEEDIKIESMLISAADEGRYPLVATNKTYYLEEHDMEAHEVLLSAGAGTYLADENRPVVGPHAWLKSPEDMEELFSDRPDALKNTINIAMRCSWKFNSHKPMLPAFPDVPEGKTEDDELARQSWDGLEQRLSFIGEKNWSGSREDYNRRLEYELSIISQMGFPGYFLIVSDFIKWAKANDIPVGPGRGSGAGSLVAWVLQITDLDPLRFDLLFERFLNPERVSMPDFDIDFCQERRGEVIQYVRDRYGDERVTHIGTLGKLKAKAAVKDAARVLQVPYPVADRYARMIPDNPTSPVTLSQAMAMEPLSEELEKADENIKNMFRIALKIEGLFRNLSTHAAGVVISDKHVDDVVPVYRDQHGAVVTQYDMKQVENAGLVKFDFLGLKTLDVIQQATNIARLDMGIDIDIARLPLEDRPTYSMLEKADSFGVFQLESAGMKQAMRQIKPSNIDDIVALVSLYRPGPMENIPVYADVKSGLMDPNYLHPIMEKILQETYGVIVYQEQVMRLAQDLAGYTLGGADILRRAMGKKIASEMEAQRGVFTDGSAQNGIDEALATEIFDLIEKFANYGFNKSHAAAYALVSWQTAYLKCHAREAFYAASMNLDIDNTEKLAEFAEEMRERNIAFLLPHVNKSKDIFSVEKNNSGQFAVRWGLAALKGVGEKAMSSLLEERDNNGNYKNFHDLVKRCISFANKKVFEGLIKGGAMDGLGPNRHSMMDALPFAMKEASSRKKDEEAGQTSLFGDFLAQESNHDIAKLDEWPDLVIMEKEFEAFEFFVRDHPVKMAPKVIRRPDLKIYTLGKIFDPAFHARDVKFAAFISKIQVKKTKEDKPFMIIKLSDQTGMKEASVFGDDFEILRPVIEEKKAYIFSAGLAVKDENSDKRLFVRSAEYLPLDTA